MVTVIITSEDEGFVLVPLHFPGFDQGFFLCLDFLQQLGSGLVIRVLRDEFAPYGEVEDLLLRQRDGFLQRLRFLVDLIHALQQTFDLHDNPLLLSEWGKRNRSLSNVFQV